MRAVRTIKISDKKIVKRGQIETISLLRRRRMKLIIRVISIICICMALLGAMFFWRSGVATKFINDFGSKVERVLVDSGLIVENISIVGTKIIPKDIIIEVAQINIGEGLLRVDISSIVKRIKQLKWVNKATIRRDFSGKIIIDILEHEPAALWQVDNKLWIVSDEGIKIDDQNLAYFSNLPMISGKGAEAELKKLLAAVSINMAMFNRVETASWVGERRWDIYLKNGIKIMLPEEGISLVWQNLVEFEQEERLLARNILAVDFRIKDKTIIRLTRKEASRRRLLAKTNGKGENI